MLRQLSRLLSLLRPLRTELACIALLFFLPLVLFWQVTIGGRTLLPADNLYQYPPFSSYRSDLGVPEVPQNGLLSDLVLENLAWKRFTIQSFQGGEFPLWNPYLFTGVPFLAAGQHSALYPFSAIYYLMPLENAYGWFTVSQLWLAGFCMYLLVRGLGLSPFAATIAGVSYQLSAFFVASVVFQMVIAACAWLPLLILMCEFVFRRRPLFGQATVIPWVVIGALALGMQILAGHVEFTYYSLLVMGFWSFCRIIGWLWTNRRRTDINLSPLIRPVASLIVMVVLGIGVGAVQFLPFLDLVGNSFREGRATYEQVRGYALPVRHIGAFFVPNLFGSPAQHTYFDPFTRTIQAVDFTVRNARITDTMLPGGKNYVEGAYYVGLLTVALAAIGVLNGLFNRYDLTSTHGPYRTILIILSVISLAFAFGTPLYGLLYYGLPGISQLHSPFRWIFPLTLCLSVLAGFGAQALFSINSIIGTSVNQTVPRSFTHRLTHWIGSGLIGVGLLVLIGLLLTIIAWSQFAPFADRLYTALAGADYVYPDARTFWSVLTTPLAHFALFTLLTGLLILTAPRFARRLIWQIAAVIVIAADLMLSIAGFNPAADPRWLQFEPPAITWLKERSDGTWRFTSLDNGRAVMNANIGWLYGLYDVRGYDSIIPKNYVTLMQDIAPQSQLLYNRIAPLFPDTLDSINKPEFGLLAVKYIVTDQQINIERYPVLKLAYEDEAVRIYEYLNFRPRAYLAETSGDRPTVTPVQILRTTATEVVLSFTKTTGTRGFLNLSDLYFNGWRAYLRPTDASADQEQEVRIEPANRVFRNISLSSDLPSGDYVVRFKYSPPAFQIGTFLSFMSAAALIFLLLIYGWGTFYRESESNTESASVRRLAKNSVAPIVLNLFNRGIDFAFAAVMLRLLGPADAGTYYYAVVIFGWFDTITNFGLNLWLTREVSRDRGAARHILFNSSLLRLALAAAGVPILIGFLAIRGATASPAEAESVGKAALAIILLYVGLAPNSISYGLTALFYAFEKAEIPAAVSTLAAILKALFGLAALILGFGVAGLAGVSILLNLITLFVLWRASVGLLLAVQSTPAHLDRPMLRRMAGSGFDLMLNNLLAGMFYKIDVTILEPIQGAAVVGQYSTAYKWLDALGVIPSLFTTALFPIMSRQAAEDRPALLRTYQFAVKLLVTLALPCAVIISALAPALIGLLGGVRYLPDGAIALQLMTWFIPIGWINSLTNYVLLALDLQKPMRWAFVAGVGFNIVANLIFIPQFSFRAAAIITILSEAVLLTGFLILLRFGLPEVNLIPVVVKPAIAAVGMIAAILVLWSVSAPLALMVGVAVYIAILIGSRPFTVEERSRLRALTG